MNREQIYDEIKNLGLKDEVKKRYGKNYTQCSNIILLNLIKEVTKDLENNKDVAKVPTCNCVCKPLYKLIAALTKKKILLKSEINAIMNY